MVTASRNWVCVRPATYESASEAEVLLSVRSARNGALENTIFALLDSKGKMMSTRSGRSPDMLYSGVEKFVAALEKHGKVVKQNEKRSLPRLANLRLAMNVAACDSVPLVIGFAAKEMERAKWVDQLAVLAWEDVVVGEAHYVVCDRADLEAFKTLEAMAKGLESGLLVVDPDDYGLEAAQLGKLKAGASQSKMTKSLVAALAKHDPEARDHRTHVRKGKREGIEWEGEIETTDPAEKRRGGGRGGN